MHIFYYKSLVVMITIFNQPNWCVNTLFIMLIFMWTNKFEAASSKGKFLYIIKYKKWFMNFFLKLTYISHKAQTFLCIIFISLHSFTNVYVFILFLFCIFCNFLDLNILFFFCIFRKIIQILNFHMFFFKCNFHTINTCYSECKQLLVYLQLIL